jgi:hypothetical protein
VKEVNDSSSGRVVGTGLIHGHVAMTELYSWLQKMMGGDETRATIVAVSIAVFGAVVLGVTIYYGIGFVAERLPSRKNRCPGCGRRALIVSWFDEYDDEGV